MWSAAPLRRKKPPDRPAGPLLAAALIFIGALLALGWWANRRYRRFTHLPGHFDWSGRASNMTPRRVMAWLLPLIFSLVLLSIPALVVMLPPDQINGDPLVGVVCARFALLAAQGSFCG